MGDRAQPAPDRITPGDHRRLARQQQKGGLENLFDIMFIAEHAPASPLHPGPVALDQGHESGLLAVADEPLQQGQVAHMHGHRLGRPPCS